MYDTNEMANDYAGDAQRAARSWLTSDGIEELKASLQMAQTGVIADIQYDFQDELIPAVSRIADALPGIEHALHRIADAIGNQ